MKIGIITITDYTNYGNRLQNYATQEVLRTMGHEVETIPNYLDRNILKKEQMNKIKNMTLNTLIIKFGNIIRRKIYRTSKEKSLLVKSLAFKQFSKEKIFEAPFTITSENISLDIANQYDFFIVGSDQVWNPNFRKGSSIDFLTFAPRNKRISFSASFGVSKLPEKYIENYSAWLTDMAHISVREDAGAEIVKELTGREVPVLVDPTLMITKEQWLSISKLAIHKPKKPYLLTYFLGEVSPEVRDQINSIAKENKLEIIRMADFEDEKRYVADPAEFLHYIYSAEIFLTDSFHGAVFSILFEKPFIIFDRISKTPSMNSRINTLLEKFQLLDRQSQNLNNSDDIFNIDFSHVSSILDFERKRTLDYLKNALDFKDEE